MASWSGAELHHGGSTSADRRYFERRNRAPRDIVSGRWNVYEEKALAREAAQREAEEYSREIEQRERDELLLPFLADDPRPDMLTEMSDWEQRRDKYLMRAEGEKIASRIARRF